MNEITHDMIRGEQVDKYLGWSLGTAAKLARKGRLPHYRLPNPKDDLRFRLVEVLRMVERVPAREEAVLA